MAIVNAGETILSTEWSSDLCPLTVKTTSPLLLAFIPTRQEAGRFLSVELTCPRERLKTNKQQKNKTIRDFLANWFDEILYTRISQPKLLTLWAG